MLEIKTVGSRKRVKSCIKFIQPNCSSVLSKWGHISLPSLCWQTPIKISKGPGLDLKTTTVTFKLTLNIMYLLFRFTETHCPLLLSSGICPLQYCARSELFNLNLKQKGLVLWVTKLNLFKRWYLLIKDIAVIQCLCLIPLSIHIPSAFQVCPQAHFHWNLSIFVYKIKIQIAFIYCFCTKLHVCRFLVVSWVKLEIFPLT